MIRSIRPAGDRPAWRTLRGVLKGAVLLSFCLALGGPAAADDEGPQMLSESHLLSGKVVLWAFRDVVNSPRKWTVRIQDASGKPLALGAILSADGWILTKGSELKLPLVCRLSDGRRFDARYVGYHEPTDTALLKIEAANLPAAKWAESTNMTEGQWLISVGTGSRPQAVGVVSVARREIPRQPHRGVLGIEFSPETEEPVILRVFEDSGAQAAGLQTGDRIVRVDDKAVNTREAVSRQIASHRPGDRVSLQFRRGTQQLTIWATLTHPFGEFLGRVAVQNAMGGDLSFRRDDFPAVIQQDAVIDPADCGGPVVNIHGEAIGINIARAGRTETYVMPFNVFDGFIDDMQKGKYPAPLRDEPGLDEAPAPPPPELPSPLPESE